MGLSEKQVRFIDALVNDPQGNITRAVIKAGYSDKGAATQGSLLLKKPEIQEVLQARRAERSKKYNRTADEILSDILEIKQRCMQAVPVLDEEGQQTGEWKFDSKAAIKALETEIRMHGLFKDKQETTHTGGISVTVKDLRGK